MKLSELSTDQSFDVLCELSPHVHNITHDDDFLSAVGRGIEDGQRLNKFGQVTLLIDRVVELLPLLLKTHRPDVYGILSVMNERPAAEIAAQKLTETMRQVRELFNDKEFIDFFTSSMQRAQTASSAPSASSPTSE